MAPPHVSQPGSARRLDIQGLRAVAVGVVVLAHAGFGWISGGFVGVDVFFVLSGFLITDLLLREHERTGRISLGEFWARRARRLLPASALVLVVTAFATVWVLPATQWKPVSTDVLWAALFSANWRFAQQSTDYFDQERAVSPVQHYWSLGVEEQYYLLWPLIIVVVGALGLRVARHRGRGAVGPATVRAGVAAAAAILSGDSFVFCVSVTATNQPYAYFATPTRAWQLGLGALLAAASPWLARALGAWSRNALAVAGLAGVVWALLALDESGRTFAYPGAIALVPTLASVALVAAGIGGTSVLGRALSVPALVKIGDWSYSIYLWHFPILVIGAHAVAPAGTTVRVALVALSVVAAGATYRLVEDPVRSHAALTKRAGPSLVLGAVLVGACACAAVVAPRTVTSPTTVTAVDGHRVDLGELLLDPTLGSTSVPVCTSLSPEDFTPEACDWFGSPNASKRVVLIGDSHGGNMRLPMDAAAQQTGVALTVLTKPGCHVADVLVYDLARKTPNNSCLRFHRVAFAQAVEAEPDAVVLISVNTDTKRVVDADGTVLDPAASRAALIEGWRRTIRTFTSEGIPVVVLQDWPVAGQPQPAECLLATRRVADCTIERSPLPSPEREAVEGLSNVRVVRLDDGWCDDEHCWPVVGDLLVYRDSNHLTRDFAQTLNPLLKREVFARLG